MPRASQGRIGISTRMTEPGEAISGVRHGAAALDSSRRYACLEVKDNGIGISPENQEKIFDPFYSTKFTGRGLGIPMVLGLVRSHNGAIAVESRPGQGCAIRVYLPAVAQDLSSAPNANAAKGRILFVDDDRSVRELGRIMLSRMGYEVSTAADGIEGLEALKRQADGFDCVLLNASMPRMDGARTLREMRRVREDLPVIVVSGRAEGELREMFAGARLSGMVGKPFRSSDLREKIEAALER
ncbi:MAG: Blue-light-activated protein [candidate division BRC1 bacterium ADurb.BinA364]|nr:MAG: Blue-light-activated protein [candidate division BRC1 bacterium ADurb.BinA364]